MSSDGNPVPALADCDDPASQFDMARIRLMDVMGRATVALAGFADAVWPIIEDYPPGWFSDDSIDDEEQHD